MCHIVVLGNGSDWCKAALSDFDRLEYAKVINSVLPCPTKSFKGTIARIHYSLKINQRIKLPFKSIWYGYFLRNICENREEKLVIIIYDRNRLANDSMFLECIRKYYNNVKLVYMFTNVVRISGANNNGFINQLNDFYDVVYAFDPADALAYNFKYSPLIYSKNSLDIKTEQKQVFYVGRAKDRYEMLMNVYSALKNLGVNRKFYIFNVSEDQQKYKDEIQYNMLIPYSECLKYIQESSCLLDVIQAESEGFTIKVCEAIFYNKRLITTNKNILDMPFYDPRFIRVIDSAEQITRDFIFSDEPVEYSEKAREYFSVNGYLNRLTRDLLGYEDEKNVFERKG